MSTFSLTGIKNQAEVSFSSNENGAATPSLGSVRFLWMSLNMRFYFKWITLNAKKKNPGPASSDAYFWVMIPDQKRDLKKMSFWGFIFAKKFLVTELSFYMKRTSLSLDRTSVKQSSFIKITFFLQSISKWFFFSQLSVSWENAWSPDCIQYCVSGHDQCKVSFSLYAAYLQSSSNPFFL